MKFRTASSNKVSQYCIWLFVILLKGFTCMLFSNSLMLWSLYCMMFFLCSLLDLEIYIAEFLSNKLSIKHNKMLCLYLMTMLYSMIYISLTIIKLLLLFYATFWLWGNFIGKLSLGMSYKHFKWIKKYAFSNKNFHTNLFSIRLLKELKLKESWSFKI